MRIAFLGTAPFAVPSLRALAASGHQVDLVVTQPDRPGHRLRLTPPAVKLAAQELGLEVFQPERISSPEALERLRAVGPELLVVAAYGQILPRPVLEVAPRGAVNVHASLLPRWRGAAPVAWAILSGDRTTGVTIMQMDEQLDHGPILAAIETEIGAEEDAESLARRLSELGAELLVRTLGRLDDLEPQPQDEAAATYAPKLRRSDGELDWEEDAERIARALRAFKPWPGVSLPLGGQRVKVLRGRAEQGQGSPGQVLRVGREGVEVACGRGSFLLQEVQLPGRRPMSPRALVASHA